MAYVTDPDLSTWTAQDLVQRFGAIPLYRIWKEMQDKLAEYFAAGARRAEAPHPRTAHTRAPQIAGK